MDAYTNQTACDAAGMEWTNDQDFSAPWTQTLFMFIGAGLQSYHG